MHDVEVRLVEREPEQHSGRGVREHDIASRSRSHRQYPGELPIGAVGSAPSLGGDTVPVVQRNGVSQSSSPSLASAVRRAPCANELTIEARDLLEDVHTPTMPDALPQGCPSPQTVHNSVVLAAMHWLWTTIGVFRRQYLLSPLRLFSPVLVLPDLFCPFLRRRCTL